MRKSFNASFISRTASMLCGVLVALCCSVFVMPSAFAKDLIVYLSRSHNTEAVARMIQTETGGELVALELQKPYPENYRATVAQVQMEDESGYRLLSEPASTTCSSSTGYSLVFPPGACSCRHRSAAFWPAMI